MLGELLELMLIERGSVVGSDDIENTELEKDFVKDSH
jgi:hypothetical protein